MTILPGSLDYLYYNGILDHIPYEAYEYPSVGQSGNNVRQELGGVIGTPGSYVQEYAMNSGSASCVYDGINQPRSILIGV